MQTWEVKYRWLRRDGKAPWLDEARTASVEVTFFPKATTVEEARLAAYEDAVRVYDASALDVEIVSVESLAAQYGRDQF